jgi:hypothetical protein
MGAVTHVSEPQRHGAVWLVPSASGARVYTVYPGWAGKLECDCDDYWFRRRRSGGVCKHVAAVWAAELEEEDDRAVGAQR